MGKMRAATVDPSAPGHVSLREVEAPTPAINEALVRLRATSMTPGEVYYSQSGIPDKPLGADIVGIIESPAADGTGPVAGTRVVGRITSGAWAELASVPTNALAVIPDNVTFEQAATLPTSGLTALYVLDRGRRILGGNVLITGASGAVGLFACQIAKLMGAKVIAQVHREEHRILVMESGADHVIVNEDAAGADEFGPYKLIAEGIGGTALSNCMNMLSEDGTCVSFGNLSESDTTFNAWSFMMRSRPWLYGFIIHKEFDFAPASEGLSRLLTLISEGKLKTHIGAEEPVERINEIAQNLSEHKIKGKAVIRMWI